jgi:hypothetical protein
MIIESFSFGALAASKSISVDGFEEIAFQLSGTASMTIVAEGTIDGINWVSLSILTMAGVAGSPAAAGIYHVRAQGLATVRLRVSAYVSGSWSITLAKSGAAFAVR